MRIELRPTMFEAVERPLITHSEFTVSTLRFDSGVAALRVRNARGEITALPYQGQQIWRASFDGRELTMRSMFDQPKATLVYLETYGGFMIHCGITGLGAPGPDDTHPLHGELPNAPFQSAWLEVSDNQVAVAGTYEHIVAFSTNYQTTVKNTLAAGAALIDVSVSVENRKSTPMDLMYLGHANFKPVDNGELHYTAHYTPETVRVRRSIPSHVTPKPGYAEFLARLADDPTLHHKLFPGLAFDPEVVFEIDMTADKDGFAHALQHHPDGTADYVRCRPEQAPLCTRWICRTPDQDGLGIAFPSTSGVEGYTAEKAKGRVETVEGGDIWQIDMQIGLLNKVEAAKMIELIDEVRQG